MISWCSRCLGLGTLGVTSHDSPVTQPLSSAHKNLRLRRSIVSRRGDLTDDSEEEDDESGDKAAWQEHYVVQRQPGADPAEHSPLPGTVVVQVQPPSTEMHRPDLEATASVNSCFLQSPDSAMPYDNASIYSSYGSTDPSSTSISNLSNVSTSPRGSIGSLVSVKSSESVVPFYNTHDGDYNVNTLNRPSSRLSPDARRPHPMFLTPEEAAKTPQPSAKVHAYSSARDRLWLGKGVLTGIIGKKEEAFAGEYLTEGQKTPIKLRSATTLRAISSFEARVDTKNNPVWYSFGTVVLALRYLLASKELEVSVVQVTELPAGREKSSIDFQVCVKPGRKRTKWIKSVKPGPSHETDGLSAQCSLKLRRVREHSLVVSAFVPGRRSHAHLALGHAVVPDLEAQALTGGQWHTFPLNLRQGCQLQDHLGMAMVALSCCERTYGFYTFTVDIMHLRNVKVQRLGSHVTSSFKVKAELWVQATLMVDGQQKAKYDMPPTPLVRPSGYDEQGWEAIFKHGCTISFAVPKDKIHLATIIVKVHGRSRHRLSSKEALLGIVSFGPEELFGGHQAVASHMDVPGDPLDSRLTHWGQALRRMAKVDMWHRLQI
ncbi:uncharacterized protein LOC122262546 [Penaeus japonicus]|uniref:uncharacterized protein LOC122262546 n=1 Tax=Penaeus japonicus TaxID=27405 RepID=UPI001C710FBF|nr:uncharacterized protein LOC122262546 [Penaeus japonicus]XP_042886492.1 uncharacterized protein LOC122262546 [Penaeus japonicus]XP_042886493.1 uncharacterized protein LOC122262546 [Penaeus japonicus]XP_042886494.1 uncharacterized protein LOC122262546 [Penaeus japonicus]